MILPLSVGVTACHQNLLGEVQVSTTAKDVQRSTQLIFFIPVRSAKNARFDPDLGSRGMASGCPPGGKLDRLISMLVRAFLAAKLGFQFHLHYSNAGLVCSGEADNTRRRNCYGGSKASRQTSWILSELGAKVEDKKSQYEIRGGSPYGAGVYAGDGFRQARKGACLLSTKAKYMASIVK
ncbi:hypothetical protein ZIOFF_037630 [Zingiber officinale]|uniref:Uncharacterized protein n=1 Tax=Zingiber officinale TaxID=94328 RepID=A0A8J5GF83_ZINOF|nr:hypothetical protein ZIOFF_037630 [Zingiber officinale]